MPQEGFKRKLTDSISNVGNRALNIEEVDFVVALIMEWIGGQLGQDMP
jgi:hypothetical protein